MSPKVVVLSLMYFASACAPRPGDTRAPVAVSADALRFLEPVWIDARFTRDQKDDIERALETWNRVTGARHEFVVASEDMLIGEFGLTRAARDALGWGVTVAWENVTPTQVFEDHVLAHVERERAITFFVNQMRPDVDYAIVALHELGHVMGLSDDDASQLMTRPYTFKQHCVDSLAIVRVATLHHWSTAGMTVQCVR